MYCPNCGKQLPDGAKFCNACGVPLGGPQSAPAQPPQPPQYTQYTEPQYTAPQPAGTPRHAAQSAPQERENVPMGILGALLGSLAGVVVMVILDQLGVVGALSGIIMMVGAVWGYRRFGKAVSVKGLIISAVIVIGMVYVGNAVCWAIEISKWTPFGFFGSLRSIPDQLENNPAFPDRYYEALAQQYLFAGIGAVIMIVQFVRENKRSRK